MKTILKLKSTAAVIILFILTSLSSNGLRANNLHKTKITEAAVMCTVIDGETGNRIGRCYFCNCKDFASSFGLLCECIK